MSDTSRRINPSKAAWFLIGAFVAIGIGAKLGVLYMYRQVRAGRV